METVYAPGFKETDRRWKVLRISPELWFNVNLAGSCTMEGMPYDAQIQAMTWDVLTNVISFRVWSSTFSLAMEGEVLSPLELLITRKEPTSKVEKTEPFLGALSYPWPGSPAASEVVCQKCGGKGVRFSDLHLKDVPCESCGGKDHPAEAECRTVEWPLLKTSEVQAAQAESLSRISIHDILEQTPLLPLEGWCTIPESPCSNRKGEAAEWVDCRRCEGTGKEPS